MDKICSLIVALLLFFIQGCSPSNTKITTNTRIVGYRANDTILITPLSGVSELDNEQLLSWATKHFESKAPKIQVLNYWDGLYESKQLGFVLPSFDSYDTTRIATLGDVLGVNYILVGTLIKLKENYDNELQNPNYQIREAIVMMKLLDLRSKSAVWYCTTRVFANPFKVKGITQNYSVNFSSGAYAVSKAYKESISKLLKSFMLIK